VGAKIILAISVAVITAFIIQNAVMVTVSFLFWQFDALLSIIVLLSALAGAVASASIAFSRSKRKA
jgi:uncharacterized integral membrane protein